MTPPRVLFLTDNQDATASLLAPLHQFNGYYEIIIKDRRGASTFTVAGFDLLLIVANASAVSDSLESCRRHRSSTRVPILFVSPHGDTKIALAAFAAGADDVIIESISIEHWNAKLRAWLRWTNTSVPQVPEPKAKVRS
jgi:two-component system response regulator ArlR